MRFGAIVMGCRKCLAAPGAACEWASGPRDAAIDFHAIRERDAAAASELWGSPGPPIDHEQNEAAELALAKAASKRAKAKLIDEGAGVSRRRKQ